MRKGANRAADRLSILGRYLAGQLPGQTVFPMSGAAMSQRMFLQFLVSVLACCVFGAGTAVGKLEADAGVDQVLDALHERGIGLKDFTADVTLTESDALGGGTTKLIGKVWYQAGEGQGRIRVLFDTKLVDDRRDAGAKVEYLLDKGWLIERDYKNRVQVDRQVLKPGQKINLLKLGEGPFPLPIGQPREEVLKMFQVRKMERSQGDPDNTLHVQLHPKPQTQFERKFKTIDIWVDQESLFPRRIETMDRNETEVRTTDLAGIRVNMGLDDRQFALEAIGGDWRIRSEEMEP